MATKQEIQLEILNLEYSRFVKDQVLTEVQLNEIIDFFEDQHRVTRTCLIGTGIVCGLPLTRHASTRVVRLGAGAAVTTDGDLMKIRDTEFKYFKEYEQPEGAHYDPFYYQQGSEEKFITLYELLTEEQKDELNTSDFGEIKDLDSQVNDWVAILFLEYYLKDPEKCTPTDCDNMGMRQVARPKVLVLSKADMDKIIHKDAGETIGDDIYLKYHDAFESYFTFPVIKARRVFLNYASTLKSTTLAGAYFTAAKNGSTALASAIKELYSAFKFILDKGGNVNSEELISKLNGHLTTPSNTLFGQYTYDYYKDVIAAYNELRDALFHVGQECCADIYSFPKHIMLGAPNIQYGPVPPEYRHRFYPSPALSKHKDLVQHAISLFTRLQSIILNFNPILPGIIKITPSRDYDATLNARAIPFYFKNINHLIKDWDHSKSMKNQEKLNLSYHADQYAPPVPDESLNPLDYDLDSSDFFRIEGHVGMEWKKAMTGLEEIRKQKGLPMDIVAVRMGDVRLADIDLDDFKCHFEDLDAILKAFQAEINCLLSEGAVFFSGFTANKERPHINLTRYVAEEGDPNWIITKAFVSAGLTGTVVQPERTTTGGITGITGRTVRERTAGFVRDAVPAAKEGMREDFLRATTGFTRAPAVKDFCDPFVRPPFKLKRVVKTKIDTDPTVFGRFYAQVLEEEVHSVDDFTEKARLLAIQDPDYNKLSEDERYIHFEYPTMIVGYLNLSQRFVPAYLSDISSRLIEDYREFAQAFCKRIKSMHTRLERYFKTGDYSMKGYENRYFTMLDNLEKICCGYEKLEVIMREVEKRKEEILKRLSFARYASDHPGLEHKAGVHRGGTFVIVYEGSQRKGRTKLTRDITALRQVTGLDSITRDGGFDPRYRDMDAFAYFIVANEDSVDLEEELSNFLSF
jgi:hypothetical protein